MTDLVPDTEYQVLARKYRPQDFGDLLGHDAMVRTLRNAFAADRIAHAFILTGVRGVGKTTTARILAKGLNCVGPDGTGGPTVEPCGVCEPCRAIAAGRHMDVLEMDAASNTGVDDAREINEMARTAPGSARFKIFIIDETHMLTKNAFNALLKTLEEPPARVKFVFATTEIRKVPVTVLSRCQRFDLKRFDAPMLAGHLAKIARAEGREVADDALLMLGAAAEGSVRDALSLLDQALIQYQDGAVDAGAVRDMLGLVDRTRSWDLLAAAMSGDAKAALTAFREAYDSGADPAATVRDLLEVTHLLTRVKAAGPEAAAHGRAGSADAERAVAAADAHALPALTRAWSLLMKALDETLAAPDPAAAAEMGLVRLAYAARLPTPEEAMRALEQGNNAGGAPPRPSPAPTPTPQAAGSARPERAGEAPAAPQPAAPRPPAPQPASLEDIVALATEHRAANIRVQLESQVVGAEVAGSRVALRVTNDASPALQATLSKALAKWTGRPWQVDVARAEGGKTLRQSREDAVRDHPMVREALDTFPGAKIEKIRKRTKEDGA